MQCKYHALLEMYSKSILLGYALHFKDQGRMRMKTFRSFRMFWELFHVIFPYLAFLNTLHTNPFDSALFVGLFLCQLSAHGECSLHTWMRQVTRVSRLLRVILVCLKPLLEGVYVTESPHQEQTLGCISVAEGQILHTTPYATSLRPPRSSGGFQRRDTPSSELLYSQDRETGAEGGAGKANTLLLKVSNQYCSL